MLKNKKIIFLTTSFPMEMNPSSGIFVSRLVNALPSSNRIVVITPDPNSGGACLSPEHIKVKPFRYSVKKWQILAHSPGGIPAALKQSRLLWMNVPLFLAAMFAACLKESHNTCLIHANWSICGLIAGLAGKLLKKPVVTTLRGEDVTRAAQKKLDWNILKYSLLLSNAVVCVNHSYRDWISGQFPAVSHKITTIENGIDNSFVQIGQQRKYTQHSPVRIVTVGSLIPRKSIAQIINAIAINGDVNILLSIVGDGPEREKLSALVSDLNIQNQVAFLGSIQPEDISGILKNHDIFILASQSEGRPNAVLEAMGSGLPIIATNISGVNELIEHNVTGLLFEYGDVDTLANHIDTLQQDRPLQKRLGQEAHRFIINNQLTWPLAAQKYQNLYDSLAADE